MHAAERCAECCVALWPSAELPSAVSGAAVKSQVVKLQACHSFTARLFAGELHCHIRTSIGLDVIGADWAGDMSSIVQLREVGFWAVTGSTPADDQRPHPNPHVDEAWAQSPAAEQLASYLRVGYIESYEMGYSNCRFGGSDGCDGEELLAAQQRQCIGEVLRTVARESRSLPDELAEVAPSSPARAALMLRAAAVQASLELLQRLLMLQRCREFFLAARGLELLLGVTRTARCLLR